MRRLICLITLISFCFSSLGFTQELNLPAIDQFIQLSPEFKPPILRGLRFYPDEPLRFDFILDEGKEKLNQEQIKEISSKLISYFLASLTIPEQDLLG